MLSIFVKPLSFNVPHLIQNKLSVVAFIILITVTGLFVNADVAGAVASEVEVAEVVPEVKADGAEAISHSVIEYSIVPFLGRLHPMILHFPIALLVLVLLFEIGALFRTSKGYQIAIWITLGVANALLLKTIWFGWILAEEPGYGGDTLFWHRWLGVAVGVLAFIALVLKFVATKKDTLSSRNQYRFMLLITVVLLMCGSHFGGNMSHGSSFLTEKMSPGFKALLNVDEGKDGVAEEGFFSNTIWPIFDQHCVECHGEEKQKGDFRVDQTASLLSGGESGKPAVVPGDAMASQLVELITLHRSDDALMPPEGKGALSNDNIMSLIHWVNLGAPMAGGEAVSAQDKPLDIKIGSDEMAVMSAEEAHRALPLWDTLKNKKSDVDFGKEIMPIFTESCVKCHGAKKQKGHLRLDSPQWILSGADGEAVLLPGNALESLLYTLTILPEDDADVMPSKGDLLTKAQTDLVKKWIDGGAGFGGYRAVATVQVKSVLEVLQEKLPLLSEAQVALIGHSSGEVQVVSQATDRLLSLSMPKRIGVTYSPLTDFEEIKSHVVWLDLSGRELTVEEFAMLPSFKQLTRLNLRQSNVTDEVVASLASLNKLRYLNLSQTAVTDKSLTALKGFNGQIYLWDSKVSAKSELALLHDLFGLKIDLGVVMPLPGSTALLEQAKTPVIVPEEEKAKASDVKLKGKITTGSCCDKAQKAGKTCDHKCCVAAAADGKVCTKCNAQKVKKAKVELVGEIKANGCCDKAQKAGKACDHKCCVAAAVNGKVCTKCNAK